MKKAASNYIKAAVIGHPIGHSLSPVIHSYWIEQYGLTGSYEALDIAPAALEQALGALVADGYRGFNVTLPHKQAVMALCETLDEAAHAIGAVNTITVDDKGRLHGFNTDAYGFIESIREGAPDFDFTSGPALVLGAGGAARAVVYSLREAGVPEIFIANRTLAKAGSLAAALGGKPVEWATKEKAAADAALLVNTTALGMKGQDKLLFDVGRLSPRALVCDIVYNPMRTMLLAEAGEAGHKVVGGLGMLLHQARPAFEKWFGILPEVTLELRSLLEEKIK